MANRTFAERLNDARLMLAGMQQHSERLARPGLDTDFVSRYNTTLGEVQNLDNEQEQLKAQLSTKTKVLKDTDASLKALYSEARKTVKLEMEPETWKEFGIQDKR